MGFRLNAIFITNKESISNEELLNQIGLENLEKWKSVDFYETNKQWESVFVGSKGKCKIICNGKLASRAFQDENPFLAFKESEIASIIWNETSDLYGFSLIKNGVIIRRTMAVGNEIKDEIGNPIKEELELKEESFFEQDEIEEIIESEGEAAFKELIKSEKICRATNNLVKRYLGTGLVQIKERIELNEYR